VQSAHPPIVLEFACEGIIKQESSRSDRPILSQCGIRVAWRRIGRLSLVLAPSSRIAPPTADRLEAAVSLDMTADWAPTARTYLGRITKSHVLAAVREEVSNDAADRMADMKKRDMAESAEQLLVGIGWLPALMRTPHAAQGSAESPRAEAFIGAKDPDAYSVAAK
jgi:hypothetical protein